MFTVLLCRLKESFSSFHNIKPLISQEIIFFDHSALKLVIQIYDFTIYYLSKCYVQLFFLHFDSNLETEANPLAGLW